MEKLDLKRQYKQLFTAPVDTPVLVQAPAQNYLAVDGQGSPDGETYRQAVEALYSLSYTLKFICKQRPDGVDYTVLPLEGLWWMENMAEFSVERKDDWLWTAMIMQPDCITAELLAVAISELRRKQKDTPALQWVQWRRWEEGLAAQIMHIGPYSAEPPTIAKLHRFIAEQGWQLAGKHHEIYLGDPRRAAPEKLKTILRQPFSRG